MKVRIKKSKNNRKNARLSRNNVNNKKRRNKSRNKTKRKKNKTKRNKRKSINKIIHNQSGGILSEDSIINQIPTKYKYDLDGAGDALWPDNKILNSRVTAWIKGLEAKETELKATIRDNPENLTSSKLETIHLIKHNIPRVTQAIPLFNEQILQEVEESKGKIKV
jgi:hypothetical protein